MKEEKEERAAIEEEEGVKDKEGQDERITCAVEEEETEWNKVRFFDQIQTKTNATLTFTTPVLLSMQRQRPAQS